MPICIAGMHRCGTSLTTRMLMDCGVYLGPEKDMLPPAPDNPEGFWENAQFMRINDGVLKAHGGAWDAPPRNCVNLPFWQPLLPDLKVLVCVRNPLAAAHSLQKRENFPIRRSLGLWSTYYQRLLEATSPADRVVSHYEMILSDPETELPRIVDGLGLPPLDDDALRRARDHVNLRLAHHRFDLDELVAAGADDELTACYQSLWTEASVFADRLPTIFPGSGS